MLYYVIYVIALAIITASVLRIRRTKREMRKGLLLLGVGLFLVGTVAGVLTTLRLEEAAAKAEWPSVEGVVIRSSVEGSRAYHPVIEYDYVMSGITYSGMSNLDAPGFGGRNKRLDVAEKLVEEYEPGDSVRVYYNPGDVSESVLVTHVPWNRFLQMGMAVFVALAGACIVMFFSFKPRRDTA